MWSVIAHLVNSAFTSLFFYYPSCVLHRHADRERQIFFLNGKIIDKVLLLPLCVLTLFTCFDNADVDYSHKKAVMAICAFPD